MLLDLRDVRVAVDDRIAVGKPREEPLLPPHARAGDVHESDPHATDVDDAPVRQLSLQRRLVHVPAHRVDRPERLELPQDGRGDDVAPVEDQVGELELTQAFVWQAPRASRQVRVGDDGDARQSERKRPSR
jgi:hypothetical protein